MFDRKKGRTSRKILKRTNFITVEHIYEYGTFFSKRKEGKEGAKNVPLLFDYQRRDGETLQYNLIF